MERPLDITKELAALKHEKKNQSMKSLPLHMTVQRRPLHHAPVASPYAGAHISKVVYVSCRTPIMSAVKRVKNLLSHVEKRALQSTEAKNYGLDKFSAKIAAVESSLAQSSEEVLVKASGRAMAQALRVGEWFRCKEKEMQCNVEIRSGNVQAVDDIVANDDQGEEVENSSEAEENTTTLEGGETTMELLGSPGQSSTGDDHEKIAAKQAISDQKVLTQEKSNRKRKRARRKRAQYDNDDIPEARLRWVKTVEVAISLRS